MGLHDDRPGQHYLKRIEGRVINRLILLTCLFPALAHDVVFNAGNGDGLAANLNNRDAASDIEPYLCLIGNANCLAGAQVVDDRLDALKGLVSPISIAKDPVGLVKSRMAFDIAELTTIATFPVTDETLVERLVQFFKLLFVKW